MPGGQLGGLAFMPFGFFIFYLKAVALPSVTMSETYWSVIPCVLVTFVGVLILIAFPDIALYFPNPFFGVSK